MRLLTFSFLKNFKCKRISWGLPSIRRISGVLQPDVVLPKTTGDPSLVAISPSWPQGEQEELRAAVLRDMQVLPEFISEREEVALLAELEPRLRRMRYEFDHWDNAIHGFRETERSQWSAENSVVLARVRGVAFAEGGEQLAHTHVLDLAAAGHIKPHIDAVRFCGDVIAGLCLASSAVMQLVHSGDARLELSALLARRALYIMKGTARYDFTHAVLGGEHSRWAGEPLPRLRRVAIICRTKPRPNDAPGAASGSVSVAD